MADRLGGRLGFSIFDEAAEWQGTDLSRVQRVLDAEVLRLTRAYADSRPPAFWPPARPIPDPGPTFYVDAAMQRVRDAVRRTSAAYPQPIPYTDTRPGQPATPSREESRMNRTTRYATAAEAAAAACLISRSDCDCANAVRARAEFEAVQKAATPRFRAVKAKSKSGGYPSFPINGVLDTSNGTVALHLDKYDAENLNDAPEEVSDWSWTAGDTLVIDDPAAPKQRFRAVRVRLIRSGGSTFYSGIHDTETGKIAPSVEASEADRLNNGTREVGYWSWAPAADYAIEGEAPKPVRFVSVQRFIGFDSVRSSVVLDSETGEALVFGYASNAARAAADLNADPLNHGRYVWTPAARVSETQKVRFSTGVAFRGDSTIPDHTVIDAQTGKVAPFIYRESAARTARDLNSGLRAISTVGWRDASEFSETRQRYVKATRFIGRRDFATNGILDRETGEFASFSRTYDVTREVGQLRDGTRSRDSLYWTPKNDNHATAQAPAEFPAEIGTGTVVKITHKRDRGNVATKTVYTSVRRSGKVTGFTTATGARYDATDYDLAIVSQPLPKDDGLYVVEGQKLSDYGTLFALKEGDWSARSLPSLQFGDISLSADAVQRQAGAKRLVALEVAE